MGKIANGQSPAFSERGQLSQAIPQFHAKRMDANRTIRTAAQRMQGLPGLVSVFWGKVDRQRTLVIRIAAITLASDSVITLARFRPSKI